MEEWEEEFPTTLTRGGQVQCKDGLLCCYVWQSWPSSSVFVCSPKGWEERRREEEKERENTTEIMRS
jgi:hypothetical protein